MQIIQLLTSNSDFSAVKGHDRGIAIGKEQTISCVINDLDIAADVKWMDVSGNQLIGPDDNSYYAIDKGIANFSGGSQTTKLTLKLPTASDIRSARTYRCSIYFADDPVSRDYGVDIVVTPISKFVSTEAMKTRSLGCNLEFCSFQQQ